MIQQILILTSRALATNSRNTTVKKQDTQDFQVFVDEEFKVLQKEAPVAAPSTRATIENAPKMVHSDRSYLRFF